MTISKNHRATEKGASLRNSGGSPNGSGLHLGRFSDQSEIRCIDLFCGAGGSSSGARAAGVRPIAGIDKWDLAVKAFQLNNPGSRIYDRALEDLDPEELSGEVGPIELMLASPECTNHSVARGGAEPNKQSQETAFQVIRFAKVLQPRWLVVENVAKMRHWEEYGNWLQQLKSIGYTNPIETVLDAQDYGVAQSRKRLFVICDREGEVSIPPKRCGCKTTMSSVIRQVSSNGNSWAFRPMKGRGLAKATWARAHRAMRALGTDEEFLLVYYGTDGAGGWQSLDRPLRTITTLDRFALVRPNGKGHEMRMLQPPELAAAMGFPEDYVWPETARRNKIKLIGNAVCPPVMQAIVSHLIRK